MKFLLFVLFLISIVVSQAQNVNGIYGIVRKNFFSYQPNPFDSTLIDQILDSSNYRLGTVDPISGFVTNLGNQTFNGAINLTGSALNPYGNTYIFQGETELISLDLSAGNLVNSVPITNPNGASYFDNFRFNNSDSTLYGLARRSFYDPLTMQAKGELFLSKIDVSTGQITEISQNSLAQGYAMAGSAIDPYDMVYYFSLGNTLMGVDIYNGNVYNSLPIINPNGIAFDNFAYNCVDSTLYGLVRNNYYSTIFDPILGISIDILDSSTITLGKIDLISGLVTVVSPSSVMTGGYSLNGGATIDPATGVYYFSNGSQVLGISTQTGLLVSNPTTTFADGQYADLMRQYQCCIDVKPTRLNVLSLEENLVNNVNLFPNPTAANVQIESNSTPEEVQVFSSVGQLLFSVQNTDKVNVENLSREAIS